MLMNLLLECQWKYLARAGTRSPPGLRVRSPNRDTQCTKQPACSKSKWLSQMLQNDPKWGGSSLFYSLCLSQSLGSLSPAWSLTCHVFLPSCAVPPCICMGPFSASPFGPLGSSLSHNVALLGSDFLFLKWVMSPILTFLFINNYRRQQLGKIEYSN